MAKLGFRSALMAATVGIIGLTAGGAGAQSLEEALSEAYLTNPTLEAQRALVRVTDEGVPQAKAGWRPNVSLVGDLNALRERNRTQTSRTNSSRLTSGIGLQVTQNVYDGGATVAALETAKSDVLAARANLASVEQTVLLNGVTAYMDVFRDTAVVDLNTQNVLRLERQLEATRDRFNAGVATLTDVAQSESRVARSQADLLSAQGDLEVSRAVFEQVIGIAPDNLSLPSLAPTLPAGREEAKAMALEQNPTILSAVYARRAALHAIDGQFADLLPQLDVVGTAGYDWDKISEDSRQRSAQISAQLTVPIYQQGFETSELRESKLSAAQALQEIEEARRTVIEEALSSWETYRSVVATIAAIQEEVRAAEIALEGVQQEELVGQRTVLDVLDAEQELLDAKVSLVQSERDETVARFQLISSIGALTAKDLGLDVELYNPALHYAETEGKWWGLGGEVETDESDADAKAVQP